MTKSARKNVPDLVIELWAACMLSGRASDRATVPGPTSSWIGSFTSVLHALEQWKIFQTIMGKCLHASTLIIDQIFVKLAGNQNRHKISDEFEFWPPDQTDHFWVFALDCRKRPYMTGITTYRNGPTKISKRTSMGAETDFSGYRNGPEQTSAQTETNFNGNQKKEGGVR